jgi:tetratricopeptide (TPR) repeat protein
MSAGEIFELIRPASVVLTTLLSTWILASARRRFSLHYALLWAGLALFLPPVIIPIYLATLLIWHPPKVEHVKHRFVVPALFLVTMLGIFAVHEVRDKRSVDSHLAQAAFAKVSSDQLTAIKQYREALRLEDNAHTHKLLALSLMEAGLENEAINEFRIAEAGGEPDDSIHLLLGRLLDKLNRRDEAAVEYQKFLMSKTCFEVDKRCDSAREVLKVRTETR